MNDCEADVLRMKMDDMRECLIETEQCIECRDETCADCEIHIMRRGFILDE